MTDDTPFTLFQQGRLSALPDEARRHLEAALEAQRNCLEVSAHPDSVVCRYVRPWSTSHEGAVDIADWSEFEHEVERFRARVTEE